MIGEQVSIRLSKAAREFNISIATIIDFLSKRGYSIESNPNTKLTHEVYAILVEEFQKDKVIKEESQKIGLIYSKKETITIDETPQKPVNEQEPEELLIKNIKTLPFETEEKVKPATKATEKPKVPEKAESELEAKPLKKKAEKKKEKKVEEKTDITEPEVESKPVEEEAPKKSDKIKVVGKIDLEQVKKKKTKKKKTDEPEEKVATSPAPEEEPKEESPGIVKEMPETIVPEAEVEPDPEVPEEKQEEIFKMVRPKLEGPTVLGKIDLPAAKDPQRKPVASSSDEKHRERKKKRKRIRPHAGEAAQVKKTEKQKFKDRKGRKETAKPEPSEEEIQKQIKETLARLSGTGKSKASKLRRQKREQVSKNLEEERVRIEEEKKILKVTEFVTASELATMINAPVTEVISTCLSLGLFVSINQRLDAETLSIVAEEFGYKVEFVSVEVQEAISDEDEDIPNTESRHPIVTVMGHVDHGKTSLLDYIRKTNVIAGESGGITQHIGAYEVTLENDRKITFLDTPGHEAFTAMRARGAKVTDVAVIVVAADDNIMPQTVEAINHAQAAGVPIVFAINKIDKSNANIDKIKEGLANMNILVEDWGGKYQCQEISAKKGLNIELLLEKILLEADILDLKANPERKALGTVIESSLDKGRGYVTKVLVQNGALGMSDIVLAGYHYGRVKAMYNERNQRIEKAGPSTPVLLLGLNGAPQAGDLFNVMTDERETKNIATKRMKLQREQSLRTQKHITLDEIGRRIAIGDFKELNLIVKGDVDGSVEALSDSLLKLSSPEIQVNVIHKAVGAVTESDVLLASASDAIIIGFQVRPSVSARKLAEQEQIDIRLYSVIYNAINEIKLAMEGMLSPDIEEKIVSNVEVRETFKITKVGTIAGCMVLDGKITRNTKIRVIRDGIVVFTGELASLKRFKDDVKEVSTGYECGLNVLNFNDIKVGDIIEGYEEIEVKRTL